MKIIFILLIMHSAIHSTITINNDTVQINNLATNQLISFNNGVLKEINCHDDLSINGNITFNNSISLPNISLINTDMFYIIIEQNNKIYKVKNNITQEKITLNTINAYQNNLTINNTNNGIIFNSNINTNTIEVNQIDKIINNNNFIELQSKSIINASFNIFGNNNGDIKTDNNTTLTILGNIININSIKENTNFIVAENLFNIPNNTLFNINTINDINNYDLLGITNDNIISNKVLIDTTTINKYTNIYNKDTLNINAPSINLTNSNITLITNKLNFLEKTIIKIDDAVKKINFKVLDSLSSSINKATFKGNTITNDQILVGYPNTKFTAYGKDFIFNHPKDSLDSYLTFPSETPRTTTGMQLVLDANEELFYLAQSSREFKENIRPLGISSDRFLEIFQDINNIQTNQDLIRTLENTELNAVIIYDENKEPLLIEERGIMAIAATQLNNINKALQSLENELESLLNS